MSGPRGMSGAGLLVVGTLCVGLLMVLGTVCALVLRGMGVPVEMQVIASALLTGVPALLAKSYHDAKNSEPVEVVEVGADPVWVEDAGEVELLYVVLIVFVIFMLLLLLGVI